MPPPEVPLAISAVPVDPACTGERWTIADIDCLGRIVAVVAMGQAQHAAEIIGSLQKAAPAINEAALREDTKKQLTISGTTIAKRNVSRIHRDGFIFEIISWIAAQQSKAGPVLLKDPHLKSTTQGIDGLMIEMDGTGKQIQRATVVEDKCSEDPRGQFHGRVMPAFQDHHVNKRGRELVAVATALISQTELKGTAATLAAERVLNLQYRRYQAALAVSAADDTDVKRAMIFKGYDELADITKDQRLASTFVTVGALRPYFDMIAAAALAAIDSWADEDV